MYMLLFNTFMFSNSVCFQIVFPRSSHYLYLICFPSQEIGGCVYLVMEVRCGVSTVVVLTYFAVECGWYFTRPVLQVQYTELLN